MCGRFNQRATATEIKEFFDLIGLPGQVLGRDSWQAEQMSALAAATMDRADAIREALARRVPALEQRARAVLDTVTTPLNGGADR